MRNIWDLVADRRPVTPLPPARVRGYSLRTWLYRTGIDVTEPQSRHGFTSGRLR